MSNHQEGMKPSKGSKFIIKHLTTLDPESLTPFEETVIESMFYIVIFIALVGIL